MFSSSYFFAQQIDLIMAPHSLQLGYHLIPLRLWITHQLAHTHRHMSTSLIWHSQGWESFQGNWCLHIEESLFNTSAVFLESFETIIYCFSLPTFLSKGHPAQTCFLPWFCWEVLRGSFCRLSGTCVETHLALYLGLLGDMFQALVCQAWFIQSELISPKKKKVPKSLQGLVWRLPCTSLTWAAWDPRDSLLGRDGWSVLTVVDLEFMVSGSVGSQLRYRRHVQVSIESWLWRALARCPAWTQRFLLSSALSFFITFVQQPVPRPF